MLNIGVLISGGGSNLQSIIDNVDKGNISGKISLVISNKKDAYGLVRGEKAGIDSLYLDPNNYIDEEDYDREIIRQMKKRNVDIIILAGYLKILTPVLIKEYKNRIVNIHPSLIPSFCGDGYYGDRVHRAVLDYGAKVTGATVHFVDEGTDTGPIIMQDIVSVKEDDTVESLQKRVLEVEHEILPKAISLICKDCVQVQDRKVYIRGD